MTVYLLTSCVLFVSGKSCGPLEEKPNTLYDYSEGIEFGDKVVITCAEGLVMN